MQKYQVLLPTYHTNQSRQLLTTEEVEGGFDFLLSVRDVGGELRERVFSFSFRKPKGC